MPLTRLDLRGVPAAELPDRVPRPPASTFPTEEVRAILDEVRRGGDDALRALTARFDGVEVDGLRVPAAEIAAAPAAVPAGLRRALELAYERILAYHRHEPDPSGDVVDDGVVVHHLVRAVGRAGLYAPGGRARYPSTVLMCAAPARVAGVEEVALCVPPGPDGHVAAESLAAAAIAGIDEVYAVGGAQAVAAMAYGTPSIAAVDVIAGPGNRYVAEAKRQVAGITGVAAAFAGPSEVVVVADETVPPAWAALDVVVQAEHGPDGLAWLVTWSPAVADAVVAEIERLVAASPRRADLEATLGSGGYAALVDGPDHAVALANVVAPEHLELMVEGAESLLPLVRRAGAVFLGPYAPASLGDYVAGPNHVLPTARTARFASALRVDDFRTHIHAVAVDAPGLARLAPHVVAIAEAEGLPAHAASVLARAAVAESGDGAGGADAAPGAGTAGAVALRPDLMALSGYHSPQVEVEVRLNTNESPLAPPPEWEQELRHEVGTIAFHRYPDRHALELRRALGEFHGVGPERIFCANGSNEVLQCLLLAYGGAGRTAALFEPTYTLHRHIANLTATAVVAGWRDARYGLDPAVVRDVLERNRPVITFLCSPNNPTGRAEPPEAVASVLAQAPGLVVVDEAYGQFAPSSALELAAAQAPGSERLVVVRTFSKTWSMAAFRLGYLVAAPAVVEACAAVALPYHLDAVKQLAGRIALRHAPAMEARVAFITEERGRLAAALGELPVETWPSDANFILFRPLARRAAEVWQELVEQSVLVRDCSTWRGLDECLRVTVGTAQENDRFLAALTRALSG